MKTKGRKIIDSAVGLFTQAKTGLEKGILLEQKQSDALIIDAQEIQAQIEGHAENIKYAEKIRDNISKIIGV